MSSSFSRAGFRREMEANLGPPTNDPNRCITDCKVWPKGVEPPDCYCQMRCVPNIFRDYETFGQRYWGCKNIEEVQKKVQHHKYRLIFKYVCLVVLLFLIILNRFLFMKVHSWSHAYPLVSFPWVDWHVDHSSWSAIYGVVEEGGWRCTQLRAHESRQDGMW